MCTSAAMFRHPRRNLRLSVAQQLHQRVTNQRGYTSKQLELHLIWPASRWEPQHLAVTAQRIPGSGVLRLLVSCVPRVHALEDTVACNAAATRTSTFRSLRVGRHWPHVRSQWLSGRRATAPVRKRPQRLAVAAELIDAAEGGENRMHINRGASAAVNPGSVRCAPGEPGSGIWPTTAGASGGPDTGKAVVARCYRVLATGAGSSSSLVRVNRLPRVLALGVLVLLVQAARLPVEWGRAVVAHR